MHDVKSSEDENSLKKIHPSKTIIESKDSDINSKSLGKKESRFSFKSILEVKEELESLVVKGYIATSHFDGQDKIPVSTLEKWKKEINEAIPRANKVSIHHEREPHVAGVGVKGTAEIHELSDGHYGLYVDTLVNPTKENFSETKYQIENNLLDSFSIEYVAPEDAVIDSEGARILDDRTELHGWTLASQPMNEHAVMIKELIKKTIKEEVKMAEEEIKNDAPVQPEESNTVEQPKEEAAPEEKVEEEAKPEEEKVEEEKVDEKELKEFRAFKAKKALEDKELQMKELVDKVTIGVKEEISKINVESKTMKNDTKIECKEIMQFKEAFKADSKLSPDSRIMIAGKMADAVGFTKNGVDAIPTTKNVFDRQYNFEIKTIGAKQVLECKGLGITTNQNTDTDYLLSAAELSDVFDPMIFNMIAQPTVTWNVLRKVDKSNKGNNQVQFTGKTAINPTVTAYTGNAVTTGNVTRLKFMTKFKKYQVGVEVDGDMIAAARGGPIGDVFAQEVADSTEDLLQLMNQDLFKEVGLETAAGVIGFEYITDSAGNTTLYNITRSADNKLSPDSAGNTYVNGASADLSLTNLRAIKRNALKEGAQIENLIYIGDHIQGDKLRGIYDAAQRTVPTSSRFGFEGRPEFDGIPFFEDKDCNDDDVFLVDLETHQIAIWVPPTLERLGKDSDSEKGFIKSYFATFNRAPRRMGQIYANAT